jgi:hypothetical protein
VFRKDDIVLHRIDELLAHRWKAKDAAKRFIFLSDIFFTADYWLKSFPTNPRMEKKREPAVRALYAVCAEELCQFFGCTINGLPRELEFMWGRNMSACGVQVDLVADRARYITRAEAVQYKLCFKHGKAYSLPWYRPADPRPRLELCDSMHSYTKEAQVLGGLPADNYGFFVLSMSRDLYMAKHFAAGQNGAKGFYHSSYVAGDSIACSGTMLIESGVVKRIRTNSGHYQPHMNNIRALIMALRMWGVPLDRVAFEDFKGNLIGVSGSVNDVLNATNNLGALKQGHNKTIADSKQAHTKKPQPDLSKSPNARDWWGNRPHLPEVQPPAVKTF